MRPTAAPKERTTSQCSNGPAEASKPQNATQQHHDLFFFSFPIKKDQVVGVLRVPSQLSTRHDHNKTPHPETPY